LVRIRCKMIKDIRGQSPGQARALLPAVGQVVTPITAEHPRACARCRDPNCRRPRGVVQAGNGTDADISDESFNGKQRDECLSLEWFRSRKKATVLSKLGGMTTRQCAHTAAWTTSHPTNSSGTISPFPIELSYRNEWLKKTEQVTSTTDLSAHG
jgi:hypothetical protein